MDKYLFAQVYINS